MMESQPLVSIIWNGDPYGDGLSDLLGQTLRNIEILISSPSAGDPDPRVLPLTYPRGKYLFYVAGNHRYEPCMLETMASRLDETGAGICVCGCLQDAKKNAVASCEATRAQRKLSLAFRLMEKQLFLSCENTLLRSGVAANFTELFAENYLSLPVCCLSNAFVIRRQPAALPKAEAGIRILGALLERGLAQ